jgi:hypothetical protein
LPLYVQSPPSKSQAAMLHPASQKLSPFIAGLHVVAHQPAGWPEQ